MPSGHCESTVCVRGWVATTFLYLVCIHGDQCPHLHLQLFAMVTMVVSEITPLAGCTVMGIALHLTILAQFSVMAVIVSGKIRTYIHTDRICTTTGSSVLCDGGRMEGRGTYSVWLLSYM